VSAVTIGTIAAGVVYVLLQWRTRTSIADSVFVSMLIAATMILMLGLRQLRQYMVNKGLDFYSFALQSTDPNAAIREHDRLCAAVFANRWMTLSGGVYGSLLGAAPFVLAVWPNASALRVSLSAFLFVVNFATGVAFYGLLVFFRHAILMGRLLKVDLWQVDNHSTRFLLGATRRLSVLASVYVSICLSSILFSVLPVDAFVVAYSCFAGAIILASVLIPSLPIAAKLRETKRRSLEEIDRQLHDLFYSALEEMRRTRGHVDLTHIESLLHMRDRIENVPTWPFRLKSVTASLSVLLLSSIPVILQILLQRVMR
jgi:hypothetical protein